MSIVRAPQVVARFFIERGYKESLREAPDFTVANFNEAVSAVLRDAGL